MPQDSRQIPRRSATLVREALEDTRVVIINGARQSGKSTLARMMLEGVPNHMAYYLDDPATRAAADADPAGFVRHDGPVLIDEVQRAPELILTIKHRVDTDDSPGQFILTGSAHLLGLSSLPDSLPGRSETIELWPLSQGEIEGAEDDFIDAAFAHGAALRVSPSTERRADYCLRALRGGFPEAVRRTEQRRRNRFFDSYVADLINRDIRQISDVDRPSDLRRILNTLAGSMAGILVTQRISNDLAIPATTVKRYLNLLELVYLIRRVPAWAPNLTARAAGAPKLIFTDSGVAGRLAGWTLAKANNILSPVGPFIENFVLSELARQVTWTESGVQLFHFRTRHGKEVDAILEGPDGSVVAVEVKAAESLRNDDFKGLRYLAEQLGARFRAGFVLYCGQQSLPFGDNLAGLPISALWRAKS